MALIPYFGEAVHAALPYIQNTGLPFTLTDEAFLTCLEHTFFSCNNKRRNRSRHSHKKWVYPYLKMDNPKTQYIRRCWDYVGELINLADTVWIEKTLPNGKVPDLILQHGNKIYVIDIKTYKVYGFQEDRHKRLLEQVQEPCRHLFLQTGLPVCGYALMFNADASYHFDPIWDKICQFIPSQGPPA